MTKAEALKTLQEYSQCKKRGLDIEVLKIAIRALNKIIQQEDREKRDLINTADILAWAKREASKDDKNKNTTEELEEWD